MVAGVQVHLHLRSREDDSLRCARAIATALAPWLGSAQGYWPQKDLPASGKGHLRGGGPLSLFWFFQKTWLDLRATAPFLASHPFANKQAKGWGTQVPPRRSRPLALWFLQKPCCGMETIPPNQKGWSLPWATPKGGAQGLGISLIKFL